MMKKKNTFFLLLVGRWKHEVIKIRNEKGLRSGKGGWDIWVNVLSNISTFLDTSVCFADPRKQKPN